ncbi:ribosomal protein S5-alanine N-acetyltransferase [Shewanella violacea]|uniref:Ribosomal-protein-alanine acetyltransferase n=1 Tax=Shewanella violacea (strain JCM 10179 / CIP 106290 / LMG 19151 / DSS12) TaxID=637905 RepID=D4ZHG1_SHEVD|nr:ribosomal protein S5-alanine N-acetyltransferase [Shewanella violacea]BAJ01110.1 ribosomal-protein-alanine acetyltransferase [Shewanella violacea DSS12]
MIIVPRIKTARCMLTLLQHYDHQVLRDYYRDNREHLSPWEPLRGKEYFSEFSVRKRLQASNELFANGGAVHFVAFLGDESVPEHGEENVTACKEIIGVCNFSNVVRGPFQACNLGYSIAEKYLGQGLMGEILSAAIDYMFKEHGLHRIMANYIPENKPSGKLLASLGFETEGLAKSYLQIAGQWQDHILTSKLNPADFS